MVSPAVRMRRVPRFLCLKKTFSTGKCVLMDFIAQQGEKKTYISNKNFFDFFHWNTCILLGLFCS